MLRNISMTMRPTKAQRMAGKVVIHQAFPSAPAVRSKIAPVSKVIVRWYGDCWDEIGGVRVQKLYVAPNQREKNRLF